MVVTPVWASFRISSIFVSIGIDFFSFCNPSRAPTSTMRTWSEANRDSVAKRRADQGARRAGSRRRRGRGTIMLDSKKRRSRTSARNSQFGRKKRGRRRRRRRRRGEPHKMRRAPCSFRTSAVSVTPHAPPQKRSNRRRGDS